MTSRSRKSGSSSQQQHRSSRSSRYRNGNTSLGGSGSLNISNLNENVPQNIMHDRRVIRGSTHSLRRSIESKLDKLEKESKQSSKRNLKQRRSKNRKKDHYKIQNKTPRPVSGRVNVEIQTEPYLEKIHVTKEQNELSTQTDPFLDHPSAPLFVPKLSGPSIATQIEAGDLFDFDHEIEPILEVLIGKTIEQSLMEVLEEEELRSFKLYKAEFEQKRNIQLAQCQRLEEEERRKTEEKQRRMEQAEKQKQAELELQRRIEAQKVATEFLENMEDAVFAELDKMGYFYDPIVKEIESVFLPKLIQDAEAKVNEIKMSNMIMDDVITHFVQNMVNESMNVLKQREDEIRQYQQQRLFEQKLNAQFVEKRSIFTQSIRSQKQDYDFKAQIIQFLNIPISVPPKEKDEAEAVEDDEENNNNENEQDEEEQELPLEIQQNITFIDELMEQFENEEEPLYKQIACMLDKIGGEVGDKIKRMDIYLEVMHSFAFEYFYHLIMHRHLASK